MRPRYDSGRKKEKKKKKKKRNVAIKKDKTYIQYIHNLQYRTVP